MFLSRLGKIQEEIDPWIFEGMKDVFATCPDFHRAIVHLPDSRHWDFHDLELPHCLKCGREMAIGGRPSWRLTNLPVKVAVETFDINDRSGKFGWLELVGSFLLSISRFWND